MLRSIFNKLIPYHIRLRKFKLKRFRQDFELFVQLDTSKRFPLLEEDFYPCLDDNTSTTYFDAQYIYHPAWAARIINETKPDLHTDISSTLYFSTIVSAFVKTEFYDYRPAILNLKDLACKQADLTGLPFATDSIKSLSCMHTIEHVGLGRYGDPISPDADLKAISELKRVCAPGGNLLIVVPVGVKRIQFNAHRIYNPADVVHYMDGFKLNNFALIDDKGEFTNDADIDYAAQQKYACGCFWFIKNEANN